MYFFFDSRTELISNPNIGQNPNPLTPMSPSQQLTMSSSKQTTDGLYRGPYKKHGQRPSKSLLISMAGVLAYLCIPAGARMPFSQGHGGRITFMFSKGEIGGDISKKSKNAMRLWPR